MLNHDFSSFASGLAPGELAGVRWLRSGYRCCRAWPTAKKGHSTFIPIPPCTSLTSLQTLVSATRTSNATAFNNTLSTVPTAAAVPGAQRHPTLKLATATTRTSNVLQQSTSTTTNKLRAPSSALPSKFQGASSTLPFRPKPPGSTTGAGAAGGLLNGQVSIGAYDGGIERDGKDVAFGAPIGEAADVLRMDSSVDA